MRRLLLPTLVLASLGAAAAMAAEPQPAAVDIPLKEVWALDMPGTRDIRELNTPDDTIVDKVLKQITESRKYNHCFAVSGEGADALREFLRVRTDHDHWNRLPAGEPVSLVFFTKPIDDDVELHAIERKGKTFVLHYRFAPRDGAETSPRLALIPIGKLPVGDFYQVKIERSPVVPKHLEAGYEEPAPQRVSDICQGCVFSIVEGPGGPPPPAELVEIPLKDVWAYNMPGTKDINEFGAPKAEDSLVMKVLRQIRESWHHHSGMVVQGEGGEALENVYRKRTKKGEWSEAPANSPLSIVFYTRGTDEHVRLHSIERQGTKFTVRYNIVPNRTQMSDSTIAIIPIGRLAAGKYSVSIVRLPLEAKYLDQGHREPPVEVVNNVCSSFSIFVRNKR